MQLPDFLQSETDSGFIRLTGHRIGLTHVVRLYSAGNSAELIAANFPTLALPLIHRVLAFYLENKAEVDAYVAADTSELRRQEEEYNRQPRTAPTLAELRRRFQTLRASGS
jgi:uncharacterized protein (DUF433 family)